MLVSRAFPRLVAKLVRFTRAGYPRDVPATDTFPVLAVLSPARPESLQHNGKQP